ncbi:MAG: ATP-binding protein [Candidatus Sumerlaeota bacterium]|nr:ATP-binding protein [Candidatus Sumerlaeota bacterium]
MIDNVSQSFRARLAEKLADSLSAPFPDSTQRRIYGAVSLSGKATAVIGMRRSGKTTFLHQIRQERLKHGVERERLPYINFEDEQLAGLAAKDLHLLIEEYYRRFPALRGKKTVTWCFDEIQAVPGWERFLRRLIDSEKIEIFISGSSASLLSRELATAMRGRAWEVVIHPFSFEEYLRHQKQAIPAQPEFLPSSERSRIEGAFLEYLAAGGFPEAQGLDTATRQRLLLDYVDVAVLRDVVERHGVTNIVGLRWMTRHLLGNAASLFSVEKFYRALKSQGLSISKDSVHHLLAHLEDCFLVRTVWMEAASERQRMVNPRKTYPVDSGLIAIFDRTGRPNTGHALETVVLVELERRRMSVTYIRTPEGHEVDFLARGAAGKMELIQVCADAADAATTERELRALAEAGRHYPKATKRLLTLTRDAMPPEVPPGVIAQPVWEWMLKGED